MRPVRLFAGLALALGLASACAPSATQLVVVVDTDLAIPGALDEVRITVSSETGVMETERQPLSSRALLPLTLAVVPSGDFLGPIDVLAEGALDGDTILERRARVTLVRGETRMLVLHLVASCVGVGCGRDQSCGERGCDDIEVADLPPWPGSPPALGTDAGRPDAGAPDGGPDAPGLDVGPVDAFVPVDAAEAPDAFRGCGSDAECDDGIDCTVDSCVDSRCAYAGDDDACDDGEDCTDDRCQVGTGCTTVANTGACNDGSFCNGFDQCAGGTCSMHTGDPCAAPTVCDEGADRCQGCVTDADCLPESLGPWGSCSYADGCVESGTRTRTRRTYACVGNACVPDDTTVSEACTRDTDGTSCGAGSCGSYGACGYSDSCDESATQSRTCTDLACASGVCRTTNRTETMACTRDTDGTMCGTTTCGSYGACDYGGTCDESASRTRTCTDRRCAAGACGSSTRDETMACTRDTDGTMCGASMCGSYGACDYASTCDEMATRSRTCTDQVCSAASCGSAMRTENEDCARDTDGTSCGSGLACVAGSCVSCAPTLSGTAGNAENAIVQVSASGSTLTFRDNDSPVNMGTITAPGVTFTGGGMSSLCFSGVSGLGDRVRFHEWGGTSHIDVLVSGATTSGMFYPPCTPTPYGCFDQCATRVSTSGSTLRLEFAGAGTGGITFACP